MGQSLVDVPPNYHYDCLFPFQKNFPHTLPTRVMRQPVLVVVAQVEDTSIQTLHGGLVPVSPASSATSFQSAPYPPGKLTRTTMTRRTKTTQAISRLKSADGREDLLCGQAEFFAADQHATLPLSQTTYPISDSIVHFPLKNALYLFLTRTREQCRRQRTRSIYRALITTPSSLLHQTLPPIKSTNVCLRSTGRSDLLMV